MLAAVALLANLFVAPASLFQNGYLEDVRGFSATTIAIFTLVTATPAGVGLIIGGRVADIRGRTPTHRRRRCRWRPRLVVCPTPSAGR